MSIGQWFITIGLWLLGLGFLAGGFILLVLNHQVSLPSVIFSISGAITLNIAVVYTYIAGPTFHLPD